MLYEVITTRSASRGRPGPGDPSGRIPGTGRLFGPLLRENLARRDPQAHRITSYNVCYTKLLRYPGALPGLRLRHRPRDHRGDLHVITSYSIHYTKLYEARFATTAAPDFIEMSCSDDSPPIIRCCSARTGTRSSSTHSPFTFLMILGRKKEKTKRATEKITLKERRSAPFPLASYNFV